MNKMGVDMTWLRSLPNFQHHPNLAYYTTTRCPSSRLSKKMRSHRCSHQAPPNPLPSQEGGGGGISHCMLSSVNMTREPGEPMVKLFLFP